MARFSFNRADDTPAEAAGRALRESGYRGPLDANGNPDTRTDDQWLADARRQARQQTGRSR